MPNPQPKEDTWAFQSIGDPFPPSPVKCPGEQNMYVALWYKHGRPIHGCARNNGGVVECSFPYEAIELKDKRDVGGQIQVLQYIEDHRTQGYWYDWIPYKERLSKNASERQLVKCGASMPLLWKKDGPHGTTSLLGYLDTTTEIGWFAHNGRTIQVAGKHLDKMLIIVRELRGGPPTCTCPDCPPKERTTSNIWSDVRAGDAFPDFPLVQALDRDLHTMPGESPKQYVALWYQQGEPVMGRVWNRDGKVAASFNWGGHEYRGNVGSLQVLRYLPDSVRGYDYGWIAFLEAANFDISRKEWHPVHVDNHKQDISPAVIVVNAQELLGKVDIRNEIASAGHEGKELRLTATDVHSAKVLCRKPKPGLRFDDN